MEIITEPWPWYVSGVMIGLMVPLLFIAANKQFGISSSLKHICAACVPSNISFFKYNWKEESWNLFFVAGIVLGGVLAQIIFPAEGLVELSRQTIDDLKALGISDFSGILPAQIFSWSNAFSVQGILFLVIGGFLVGFGTRYAGGCTSGHAIMGLSNLQKASLFAVIGFFIGGLMMTYLFLPYLI